LPQLPVTAAELRQVVEQVPEINWIMGKVDELIDQHQERFATHFEFDGEALGPEVFPPCIRAILGRVEQAVNLTHYERLAIAMFLININNDVEAVVEIFSTLPDFDNEVARYHVNHLAGFGSNQTRYTMFNCEKMVSMNMCCATHPTYGDPICAEGVRTRKRPEPHKIKNPLNYIFWKRVALDREAREARRGNAGATTQAQEEGAPE
jgi:DNA primase large subunit